MQDEISAEEMPSTTGGKFLKGVDVVGKLIPATILSVGSVTFNDGRTVRNVQLNMKDLGERGLTLNKTRVAALVGAYGLNAKNWVGKSIQLTSTKVNNPVTKQLVDSVVIIATA